MKILEFFKKTLPFLFLVQKNDLIIGTILKSHLLITVRFLRDSSLCNYKVLSYIAVVDYPLRQSRFEVVYDFLSTTHNHRFRLKTYAHENTMLDSLTSLYPSANWNEREAWDIFGVFFKEHPDLRRILSDYGFEGHPLRKDFPLSGYLDLRYDENFKRVVVESLSLDQSFRVFNYNKNTL